MNPQPIKRTKSALRELRTCLLAAISELDLKGTDLRVTQAMCIIEEAFNAATLGKKVRPRQIFLSGIANAKSASD